MSPLRFRPEIIRVPWQALTGFAVAIYVLRSILRNWDFRPNLLDVVVFGSFALILIARPVMARLLGGEDPGESASAESEEASAEASGESGSKI